jgi:hypothetical protein
VLVFVELPPRLWLRRGADTPHSSIHTINIKSLLFNRYEGIKLMIQVIEASVSLSCELM